MPTNFLIYVYINMPVNIQTLRETVFNPRLNQEELHYWDTDTVIRHVLHFLDERTLVRVTQARMGLFSELHWRRLWRTNGVTFVLCV